MLSDKRLVLIGGGNMGEAILKGLIAAQLVKPQQVTVTDVIEARLTYLRETYAVQALTDNGKAVGQADLIILAVKPQDIVPDDRGDCIGSARPPGADLDCRWSADSEDRGVPLESRCGWCG